VKVYILATCNNELLLPYTLLVFKTLRIGFPTTQIEVHINSINSWTNDIVEVANSINVTTITFIDRTIHHQWIESLVNVNEEPFWICDTDIIFYKSIEDWSEFNADIPLAGAFIPEFCCPFLKTLTQGRLHTSLMYINPRELLRCYNLYLSFQPKTVFNPHANPFYPLVFPILGIPLFYDTLSVMYNAIGGFKFTPEQQDCYFHFHFGTISDLILPHLNPIEGNTREAILKQPELGKGVWKKQLDWLNSRHPSKIL